MIDWQGKRYWLIGAGEGLSREVALCLSRAGAEVIVSAKEGDALNDIVSDMPGKATAHPLDVTDRSAVKAAASEIGDVDGLLYLLSVHEPMTAADWDSDKAEEMAELNYMGAVRSLGAVVGGMVARDAGHIVLTGALAGYRGLPGSIGFGASKAAVMNLAESLQADLRRTNVRVQVVNPGPIKSGDAAGMDPKEAAQEIFEHMNDDAFKKSFPLAASWSHRLGQFLPDWAYYRAVGKN